MSATRNTSNSAKLFDTGFGTTPGMWQLLSELIDGEQLPESLNGAIYALCADEAEVCRKVDTLLIMP